MDEKYPESRSPSDLISFYEGELVALEQSDEYLAIVQDHNFLLYDTIYSQGPHTATFIAQRKLLRKRLDLIATIRSLRRKQMRRRLVFESSEEIVQNLNESSKPQDQAGFDSTPRIDVGQGTNLEMSDFLSRPVEIYRATMPFSTVPAPVKLDVWSLHSLEPSVRAKLRNYAYYRADLRLRIIVSGNPFHYGQILFSYQPYPDLNGNIPGLSGRAEIGNYFSQSPQCAVVDVKANTPVEMTCPFISPKAVHRLYNSTTTAISAATPYADLESAGSLYLHILNPIESVSSGVPTQVYVQIYAWLENVELGVTTATQVAVTTESDEYKTGPVENVLSKVAAVAAIGEKIPAIKPIATPSKMVIEAARDMAAHLGWSKPSVEDEPIFTKVRPFEYGPHGIGRYTGAKITYDPKQELSVDSFPIGEGDDDLVISTIAGRQTYLDYFTWATTSSVMGSPIFRMAVTPQLSTYTSAGLGHRIQPTAAAFAVSPFTYWRGTLHVKMQVVVSAYHRGKLLVYYEPNFHQSALIDTDIEMNKNYIKILDLAETDTIEFDIDWACPTAWNKLVPNGDVNHLYGVDFDTSLIQDFNVNGYIGVTPFTALQTPDDTSVDVNVYISCPDLRVNCMSSTNIPTSRLVFEMATEVITQGVSTKNTLNPTTAGQDYISEFHFGEEPISYRALLKRFVTLNRSNTVAGAPGDRNFSIENAILPPPLPIYGAGSLGFPNLFGYMRYAYIGMRGSLRYRYYYSTFSASVSPMDVAVVTLMPPSSTDSFFIPTRSTGILPTNMEGSAAYIPRTNGGLEFELPFYSNNLFVFSFDANSGASLSTGEMDQTWFRNFKITIPTDESSGNFVFDIAAGEDFQFLGFQGSPHYYV